MIVGFLKDAVPAGECEGTIANLPAPVKIALSYYGNPRAALLTENALLTLPSITVIIRDDSGTRSTTIELSGDGVASVRKALLDTMVKSETEIHFTFFLPQPSGTKPCWDIVATEGVNKKTLKCASVSGRLDCGMGVPGFSRLVESGAKMRFEIAPSRPSWLKLLPATHAMQLSFSSYERVATQHAEIRVARSGARSTPHVAFQMVEGH